MLCSIGCIITPIKKKKKKKKKKKNLETKFTKKKKKKKKKEKKKKERMQILTETRYRVEGWPVSGTRGAARRSC